MISRINKRIKTQPNFTWSKTNNCFNSILAALGGERLFFYREKKVHKLWTQVGLPLSQNEYNRDQKFISAFYERLN